MKFEGEWIEVSKEKPSKRQNAYVVVKTTYLFHNEERHHYYQTKAEYIPYMTVPEEDFMSHEYHGEGDYDEEKDEYYAIEGWYEAGYEAEINYRISGDVIFWCPLFDIKELLESFENKNN